MAESSGEVPVPKQIIVIETSAGDGDNNITPEEQEAINRYESRKLLAKSLVDSVLPDQTVQQHLESVARKYSTAVESFDDELKAEARNALKDDIYDKQRLVYKITQTTVPDSDLAEYVSALSTFTSTVLSEGKKLSSLSIGGWVHAFESVEKVKLYQGLAEQWKAKFMTGVDKTTLKKRLSDFYHVVTGLTGCNLFKKPEQRDKEHTSELFAAFMELYDYTYFLSRQREEDDMDRYMRYGAEQVGLITNDPEQTRLMLQLYREVAGYQDRDVGAKFADAVSRYSQHHGITRDKVRGLVDKLLPAMQQKDAQLEILLNGGNIWGMKRGDFGVGDFLCHAYASQVKLGNLNELLLAAREASVTSFSRFEQSRIDALAMVKPFGILRDFIHNQQPHVHEVLTAMVNYYDTGDRSQLELILPKTTYFNSDEGDHKMFDRSNYEIEVIEPTIPGSKVRAVDVLKRLVENTKPVPDTPPTTSDEQLNQMLEVLEKELVEMKTVSKETLILTVDYINTELLSKMEARTVGFEPNHVLAISWIERRAFEIVSGMKYEEQIVAYKQEWFLSLLLFQELIGSAGFNQKEFKSFTDTLRGMDSSVDAYKIIGKRTLENIHRLAVGYKQKGRTDLGALWSGNLAHELIGLVDLKPAETEQGRKFRNENIKRMVESGYHPGD